MISWVEDAAFTLDGVEFALSIDTSAEQQTDENVLLVFKSPQLVRSYETLRETVGRIDRVVEIGTYRGGSCAMMALLYEPELLVTIDASSEVPQALKRFITERGLEDRVKAITMVDQGDRAALLDAVRSEFGTESLDIVIDDASHQYRETKSSFETLFPLLRPGGVFVIEDWSWAHYPEQMWQKAGGYWPNKPALTNLITELTMIAGSGLDVITEVRLDSGTAHAVRGPAELDTPMRLDDHYRNRGLEFRPFL